MVCLRSISVDTLHKGDTDNNNKNKKIIIIIIKVQTDRTIPNNKPDIIIRNNEKRTCMLIDVAISGDRNVIKKEAEKLLKYKDACGM